MPFELTAICEEVVVKKMYFHGDSISIAGFPQATLFCMRRSLGEMELHRIWEAFASAAIASNLHLKERKDMHAMHAHLDLEKKYFQLAGSVAFLALQLFFCPSLTELHHSYFECFPIAPLFCLSILPTHPLLSIAPSHPSE